MRRIHWLLISLVAAVFVVAWAGLRGQAQKTATVTSGVIEDRIVARAIVEPFEGIAEIRPQCDGSVARVLVREGDTVVVGQLLAEIKSEATEATIEQREAERRAIAATADIVRRGARPEERSALESDVRAAALVLGVAKSRADQDRRLFETGAMAEQPFRESEKAERLADAELKRAEARLSLAHRGGSAEIDVGRHKIEAAEAAVRVARRTLDQTRLLAPIAGTVIRRRVDTGDVVLGALNATASPAFEIADLSKLALRIEVEEQRASEVSAGLEASLRFPGGTAIPGSFRIKRVSPSFGPRTIDADDLRSRANGRVRAAWIEPILAATGLMLGQRLEAVIKLPGRHVSGLMPRRAVRIQDGQVTVLVPSPLWTSQKVVQLGSADDDVVEVVGIEPGTAVVLLSNP